MTAKLLAHEMARIQSNDFQLSIVNPVSASNISNGNFQSPYHQKALSNFSNSNFPFFIWEFDDTNIDSLISDIEKICINSDKPPIVAIDYLQLLTTGNDNTKSALDYVIHKIFACRRKTNTTFVIISSLNRANYQTEISFESFKESGSIEYSADVIWGLQLLLDNRTRSNAELAKKQIPRHIQLKCLKNRFGSNFDIGFFYYPNCDTFLPMLEYGDFTDHHISNTKDSSNDSDDDDAFN